MYTYIYIYVYTHLYIYIYIYIIGWWNTVGSRGAQLTVAQATLTRLPLLSAAGIWRQVPVPPAVNLQTKVSYGVLTTISRTIHSK